MWGVRKGRKVQSAILAIVLLVGLTAFMLGRLSVGEAPKSATPVVRAYVGSKSGNVYYLPACKGAKAISPANKVWYATAAEAESAGYTKAANCPDL